MGQRVPVPCLVPLGKEAVYVKFRMRHNGMVLGMGLCMRHVRLDGELGMHRPMLGTYHSVGITQQHSLLRDLDIGYGTQA